MKDFFIKIEQEKGSHAGELSRAMQIQTESRIILLPFLLHYAILQVSLDPQVMIIPTRIKSFI